MKITHIGKPDKNFMCDIVFEHGMVEDYYEGDYSATHAGKISLEAVYYLKKKDPQNENR